MESQNLAGYYVLDIERSQPWVLTKDGEIDIAIMRMVVREHFSKDMAAILYGDILNELKA